MKKKILSLAVATGLVAAASATQAQMHINDRGLGEALVYPFYSAANGNDTYVHLVNTTSVVKAVKVRFIEGMNSQEVLDFNLYLSPEDVWAGVITATEDGGALIRTVDTSCSVPMLGSQGAGTVTQQNGKTVRDQPFVNTKYAAGVAADAEDLRSIGRTQQGYIEVIEMGQLDPNGPATGPNALKGAMAVHNGATPANCAGLVAAWSTGGDWLVNGASDEFIGWPAATNAGTNGGLYGFGVVINVAEGTSVGYDAVAIDGFVDPLVTNDLHRAPGSEEPSLLDASQTQVAIADGAIYNNYDFFLSANPSRDAVTSLFMTAQLMNDFVVDPAINAATDWVVTMPTKRFFVQPTNPVTDADAPFANRWDRQDGEACEPFASTIWDREEAYEEISQGPIFSPAPADPTIVDNALCEEVNVIRFGEYSALRSDVREPGNIGVGMEVDPGYNEGWATIDFVNGFATQLPAGSRELVADGGEVLEGLPVTGFAVFSYQNGVLGDGVLSNYAAASEHKTAISVQ